MRITSTGDVGIGTSSPVRPLHVYYNSAVVGAYTAVLQGAGGGYGAGVSFQSVLTGGALAEMARITADGESSWNTTASTQDAGLRFYTALDGTVAEKMRLNSDGNLSITGSGNGTVTIGSSAGAYSSVLNMNSSAGGGSVLVASQSFAVQTVGTERMRIDTSGNVGIGTSSPSSKLDVNGKISLTGGEDQQLQWTNNSQTWRLNNSTAGQMYLYNVTSARFPFKVNAATASDTLCLTSTGVGIGTSSPGVKLDVAGDIRSTSGNYYAANGGVYGWGSLASYIGGSSSTNVITFQTNSSERMRIDSSGNVGIGLTNPSSYGRLVVGDTSNTTNNIFQILTRYATVAIVADATTAANGAAIDVSWASGGQGPLRFNLAGSEKARIDSSGNLLVGTTANGLSAKAVVETTTNAVTAVFSMNRNVNVDNVTFYHQYAQSTNSAVQCRFLNSGAVSIGSITSSGTATAYNTSSDYRLKAIDGPVANSGAYIDALNPVQGSWKVDGSRFIGLLAHEVQEVSETPIATGEKDGEEMQAMDYSAPELIANLIAEIQSLRARVAQLEGK
jgi:hypothetical protein